SADVGGSQIGPILAQAPVGVSNGLLFVTLDFGTGVFDGSARWLEIAVRTNGSADSYDLLSPRTQIRPTPYAMYAGIAGTASVANAVPPDANPSAGIQNGTITAAKLANGQVVKSLNGLTDALTLSAGAGLSLTGLTFAVGPLAITTAMLADGAVSTLKL